MNMSQYVTSGCQSLSRLYMLQAVLCHWLFSTCTSWHISLLIYHKLRNLLLQMSTVAINIDWKSTWKVVLWDTVRCRLKNSSVILFYFRTNITGMIDERLIPMNPHYTRYRPTVNGKLKILRVGPKNGKPGGKAGTTNILMLISTEQ